MPRWAHSIAKCQLDMITIESSALLTIGISLASIAVTSYVTWHFSKRHYSRTRTRTVAPLDVELEKAKLTARNELWLLVGVVIVALAVLLLMGYCAAYLPESTR